MPIYIYYLNEVKNVKNGSRDGETMANVDHLLLTHVGWMKESSSDWGMQIVEASSMLIIIWIMCVSTWFFGRICLHISTSAHYSLELNVHFLLIQQNQSTL
jgi:hypothetical protein